MTAPTTVSDIINKLTGGASGLFEPVMVPVIAHASHSWAIGCSYTSWGGNYFGAGGGTTTPGAVAALSMSSAGAVPFIPPTGGRQKHIISSFVSTISSFDSVGYVQIYDRLLHIGGLSGTVTTAQTVGGTITRNTGGEGNRIYVEIWTSVGATPVTITASYTNQAGTSGRTTGAHPFGGGATDYNNDGGAYFELPLQAGDTGVRSVESVTVSSTTGTAGNFGVCIGRPILSLSSQAQGVNAVQTSIGVADLPYFESGACLAAFHSSYTTTESPITVGLITVES